MSEPAVKPGEYFWQGDIAIAEGAIAAGCRFFAGYPITPASEVAERIAERMPLVGGVAVQMENEIASILAVIGACWGGKKAMTATSGPGLSLMQEGIGLAVMMEAPCVIVDVQRGGPSTGLPTMWSQADVMQARWGSHGDYELIAVAPSSPQEAFDFMIDAFNYAELWRVPVIVLTDGIVGHMTEKVVVPPPEEIAKRVVERRYTTLPPEEYLPYHVDEGEWVPPMVKAGDGYFIHTTGLTHDERGYPDMTAEAQDRLVRRLVDKIRKNAQKICRYELFAPTGEKVKSTSEIEADVCVVTFGVTSRLAAPAIAEAKKRGLRVAHLRLVTVWPFPEWVIRDLAQRVAGFCVVEMNLGQLVYEVERCAAGKARTVLCGHAGGGLYKLESMVETIMSAAGVGKKGDTPCAQQRQ